MMVTGSTAALQQMIDRSRRIVFFGGAGVGSNESYLPQTNNRRLRSNRRSSILPAFAVLITVLDVEVNRIVESGGGFVIEDAYH